MAYLKWISDQDLNDATQKLLHKAKETLTTVERDINKNVVDPFSAIFQMGGFSISYDEWLIAEKTRQAQKSLQNHVGDFHQNVLGSVKGWRNQKTGNIIDLICKERKILAEVKNKHNTVTGGSLSDLYKNMDSLVSPKNSNFKDYTAYYVTIIPKKPEPIDKPFTPSDRNRGQQCTSNELIRVIDGASFYNLVTEDKNALRDLFLVLPIVIENLTDRKFDDNELESILSLFRSAYGI